MSNCQRAALKDARERAARKLFPESIVYMRPDGRPELDSWIKPGSVVRLWGSMVLNKTAVHQLFSEKFGDTSRLDHIIAEIVTHGPDGTRRDFDLGYVYTGKPKLGHNLRQYSGRIISPDWIYIDKAKSQVKHPEGEFLRLVAIGVLTEDAWKRLKHLVESPDSTVSREGDKEGRHVYDIRNPVLGGYRAAVPWVAGGALGNCHNCASFVMDLFRGMLTCVTRTLLVVPGSCRALPAGHEPLCTDAGLPATGARPRPAATDESVAEEPQVKRRRLKA
jgi:hypothetical protein